MPPFPLTNVIQLLSPVVIILRDTLLLQSCHQEAIAEFNDARRDQEYRHEAIMHMIEMYLFPDPSDGCSLEVSCRLLVV